MTPTPRRARLLRVAQLLPLFVGASFLAAAPSPASPPATGAPRAGAVPLSAQPVTIQSLGLSLRLPEGVAYETLRVGAGELGFAATAPDGRWKLSLHSPTSRNKQLTAPGVAAGLIRELEQSRAALQNDKARKQVVGSATGIFEKNDALQVAGLPAAQFFAALPNSVGGATVVNGYTIVQVGPGRFAILQLDSLEEHYTAARAVYDAVLSTVTFRDPADMASERASGIKAGEAFLASLTREQLEAALAVGEPVWYRVYKPAPTGSRADAEEVAYQTIEMRVGKRGELDRKKSPQRYTAADQQMGILVRVVARVRTPDAMLDTDSGFFQTFDRSSETWSIRMVMKDDKSPKNSVTASEIGTRDGDSIKVQVEQSGQTPITKTWKKPPEAYLGQAERYLLPRLLAQFGAPVALNFYSYQSKDASILIRRDILEPAAKEGSTGPAAPAWTLRSRPDEDTPDDTTTLNSQGDLIRRVTSDGVVWEPVKLDELKAIWKKKGLPMS